MNPEINVIFKKFSYSMLFEQEGSMNKSVRIELYVPHSRKHEWSNSSELQDFGGKKHIFIKTEEHLNF